MGGGLKGEGVSFGWSALADCVQQSAPMGGRKSQTLMQIEELMCMRRTDHSIIVSTIVFFQDGGWGNQG